MTDLLYYKEPYLKEIEATVIEYKDNGVVFDRTIFYPECGGQPGDKGFFGEYKVIDTQKGEDGTPIHIFEGELPPIGTKATLILDWNHRYFFMKEHSAQHLLSSILFHDFGIGTVSVHQGDDILTIETDSSSISKDILLKVEERAIEEIGHNRTIYQKEMSRIDAENLHMRRSIKVDSDNVLVVFIEGLDAVACGGVHLSSTGEIGEICYRGQETIRGHVRTIWSVGEKAREYRRINEKAVKEACCLLSSEPSFVPEEIERLQQILLDTKKELRDLRKKLLKIELESHINEGAIIYSTEYPIEDLPEIIGSLSLHQTIFIVEKGEKPGFVFFGTKDDFNKIKEAGFIKGGGREPLFRGTVLIDVQDAIEKVKRMHFSN